MKRLALVGLTLLLIAGVSTDAFGFINGPPWYNPNQAGTRHFRFDLSNYGGVWDGYTYVGPPWDSPGWECDDAYWSANIQWFNMAPTWDARQGVLGIDNRQGTELLSGTINLHINNFDNLNPEKKVWDEIEYFLGGGATILHGLYPPPGTTFSTSSILNHMNLADGGIRENLGGMIQPNPLWEEIKIDFFVPVGGQAYLDFIEVATACIPEPATLGLLSIVGLALLRRR